METFSGWLLDREVVLVLICLMRIVGRIVVVGHSIGWRLEHARMVERSSTRISSRHEPQLVHPLLLASFILEPDLDNSHT